MSSRSNATVGRRSAFFIAAASAALAVAVAAPSAGAFTVGLEPYGSPSGSFTTAALRATNAGVLRTFAYWHQIAPTKPANPANPADPAYKWIRLDADVRSAADAGAEPLINILSAPSWAEGPRRASSARAGTWKPNAAQVGFFGAALATRYSGTTADPLGPAGRKLPRVRLYGGWNEPNYQAYLTPRSEAVELNRAMQNKYYDAIKAVQPTATVALGGLGPYGSNKASSEIQPQVFLEQILCLNGSWRLATPVACPVKVKFDAADFHPYTWFGDPTTRAASPDGGALGNAPDFRKLLDYAIKWKTVLPEGAKQLWVTEFGWLTNAPGRKVSRTTTVGISPATAGAYTSETLYRLWAAGVNIAVWYSIVDTKDPKPLANSDRNWPGGLYFWPGLKTYCASSAVPCAKPAVQAMRFPVFATKSKLWAMSPCRGVGATVTFQSRVTATSAWVTAGTVAPGADGVATKSWTAPTNATLVRATGAGTSCSDTGVTVKIATH